jgi:hypothetical protein
VQQLQNNFYRRETKDFMPVNPVKEAIKQTQFVKALVETGGNAKEAYKAIAPHVTDGSAKELGSRALARVDVDDINELYKKIGCTKDVVLKQLYERMQKTRKDETYIKGAVLLAKIGGWETKNSPFADLLARDMDLVEIIKIRLSKRSNAKPLDKVIDVDNSSSNSNK